MLLMNQRAARLNVGPWSLPSNSLVASMAAAQRIALAIITMVISFLSRLMVELEAE